MASRSGSVDPGLCCICSARGSASDALEQGLQHHSGLLGLSGLSGDWRELRRAAAEGHGGAQLAMAVFLHQLRAGIGAMAASLGGVAWRQIAADEEGMIARLVSRADPGFGAVAG